jgi:hypothetical protein
MVVVVEVLVDVVVEEVVAPVVVVEVVALVVVLISLVVVVVSGVGCNDSQPIINNTKEKDNTERIKTFLIINNPL